MKVAVLGANGRVGFKLVKRLLDEGHYVIAYTRSLGKYRTIEHPNLKVSIGNMNETLRLRDSICEADVCISTMGSSITTSDSIGFVEAVYRLISTMEMEEIPRFIYLSSLGAGESSLYYPRLMGSILTKFIFRLCLAHHTTNEERIYASELNWTIVRPGRFYESEEKKTYTHGWKRIKLHCLPKISIDNTIDFLIKQLKDKTYFKKSVWLYEAN